MRADISKNYCTIQSSIDFELFHPNNFPVDQIFATRIVPQYSAFKEPPLSTFKIIINFISVSQYLATSTNWGHSN